MRPPGFPGNPPARMPRAPTPARSPPPRPLQRRRCSLPSNARRRPSRPMHFGAQSRGLRTPCERFAPWVTPGPRITRFRLVADLGRMGLDTHRVSNKVSKITSRHLVPLDRAFPAHALVHEYPLPVGRRGSHFSGPSAGATLQGCSRRSIPGTRRITALRTGQPTIRPSFDAAM